VISSNDVALIERLVPEFSQWHQKHGMLSIRRELDSESSLDNYLFLSALWLYTASLLETSCGDAEEDILDRIFGLIENIIAEGDESASAAACIGSLSTLRRRKRATSRGSMSGWVPNRRTVGRTCIGRPGQ
jgi:hypothetical protein